MRKPSLGYVGIGLIGIGSTLLATPASAAIVCGAAPNGGTLVSAGDYCQLSFTGPGEYSFTVPQSSDQLFALVVGAGAGAITDSNDYHEGYAGNAGKVSYKDMSDSIGEPLNIVVGAGGTSGTDSGAANGQDSSVTAPSTTNSAIAFGGSGASFANACNYDIWQGGLLVVGEGARTGSELSNNGGLCLGGHGLGVNPFNGDVDSEGAAVPSIFSDLNLTFGSGGSMAAYVDSLPVQQTGDGAGFLLNTTDTQFVSVQANGGNGAAYLRWTPSNSNENSLANTGGNGIEVSIFATSLIAVGLSLNLASKMRRRTWSKPRAQ